MRHLDRLSTLPDELIIIILSFLPTKYSVRTSILSTRWKYLFAYVPFLDFDIFPPDNSDAITTKYNYVDFVDYDDNSPSVSFTDQRNVETTRINFKNYVSRVLSLYNVNPMDKFRLHCGTAVDHNFGSWINSVLIRNVKEIDVFVVFRQLEWLTREIFSCQRLSVLKVHGNFFLVVPDSACLPCLKTLHFRHVSFGLFSGKVLSLSIFPLLEDFMLDTCKLENVDTLDLSHPTIRQISIRKCKGYVLVMDAPSLLCFEFFESLASEISENTKVTSLVKARVSISVGYKVTHSIYGVIKKLVCVVSQARHLDLCMETIKIFGNPYSNLPTFSNLTCLEIGYVSRFAFASLPNLLNRSNQLEAIIFRKGFIASQWEDTDLLSFTTVPSCLSLYLKEVEFREFAMGETGSKVEGKLVEYFLRNCQFLERLKIRFYNSGIEQVEFTKKLLTFPKCSRDCQILIDSNYVTKE